MSGFDADATAVCPCGSTVHPAVVSNPPGLSAIAYRVGDYTAFRHALLQARRGETELSRADTARVVQVWRPGASGDLAVQLIEWWAYLADVLTFYNERVASQAYLRTAELPESVNRLIRLLGYRPRPGLGATGVLAALANGPKAFTLPAGFQVQSKPGPGQQPQVFELGVATPLGVVTTTPGTGPQGELPVMPGPDTAFAGVQPGNRVLLQGAATLKPGDRLLFWRSDASAVWALATVAATTRQNDPQAGPVTQVQFEADDDLSAVTDVTRFRLLRSSQSVALWQFPADPGFVVAADVGGAHGVVDLQTVVRGLKVGDPLLFEAPAGLIPGGAQLVVATSATEAVWYANPKGYLPAGAGPALRMETVQSLAFQATALQNASELAPAASGTDIISIFNPATVINPGVPPDPSTNIPPVPIPHTRLGFTPAIASLANANDTASTRSRVTIWYGWQDAGTLVAASPVSVGGPLDTGQTMTLLPLPGAALPVVTQTTPLLVEDQIGNGVAGTLDATPALALADPVPVLYSPLRALFNLFPVTRGKTVANEVLGNGNAAVAGQDFALKNVPVTYLQNPGSASGDNYSSTVRVWVNGLEWQEVRSFYAQESAARIFVTREDEQGQTHVLFGDGEHGARLPTGVNNVVATYRYGSGALAPDAGSLTVVLQPQPGLKAVRNPVRVGGGADPDPPATIRRLAPRSVLMFDRAVSIEDYEAIATQAPAVARAKAYFSFDPAVQRPRVKIWVGDDPAALNAARAAVAAAADPNRLPGIALAAAVAIHLRLTLGLDPRAVPATVLATVRGALLDPDAGLLGVNAVGIGQACYDSQISAACLAVPGVRSVNDYDFSLATAGAAPTATGNFSACQCQHRHDPGEGGYFLLQDADLVLLTAPAP